MIEYLFLFAVAFVAGTLNTVAGGGSFLTFPALVFVGIPVVAANVTNALAVFPGYLAGAFGFRDELKNFDRRELVKLLLITVAGSGIGSILLLNSSNKAFGYLVPVLLFVSTLMFIFSGQIRDFAARNSMAFTPYGAISLFVVSVYGGYFNGGMGIILLALFSLWGLTNLNLMNGLKSGLSFSLSAISVSVFVYAGNIFWTEAAIMMAGTTIGGYLGAPLARKLPTKVVRAIIGCVGLVMTVVFVVRLMA